VNTTADLPQLPAVVDGIVAHRRRGTTAHSFRHTAYQWLVDLDHLPDLPWYLRPFAGFDVRDHLFGATGSDLSNRDGADRKGADSKGSDSKGSGIRGSLERFLADNGVRLGHGARYVMLANARVFGHVFDPLSVFWCFDGDGGLSCLVAEVHNTYGERHAYLLTLDANGEAEVDKHFYVSPFNDVSGRYLMHFDVSKRRLSVRIALVREEQPRFDATFAGAVLPATPRTVARMAIRRPVMPQKVSTLIRFHGIRLWLKGLAVSPRPVPTSERV
jgi:DUF1365 family protein